MKQPTSEFIFQMLLNFHNLQLICLVHVTKKMGSNSIPCLHYSHFHAHVNTNSPKNMVSMVIKQRS